MAAVLAASTEGRAVVAAPALLLPVRACPRHRRHARLPRAPSDSPGQKLVGALLDAAVLFSMGGAVLAAPGRLGLAGRRRASGWLAAARLGLAGRRPASSWPAAARPGLAGRRVSGQSRGERGEVEGRERD